MAKKSNIVGSGCRLLIKLRVSIRGSQLISESHTLILVDEERLCLHSDVLLQCELVLVQCLHGLLAVRQSLLQLLHRTVNLVHLSNKAVLDWVSD